MINFINDISCRSLCLLNIIYRIQIQHSEFGFTVFYLRLRPFHLFIGSIVFRIQSKLCSISRSRNRTCTGNGLGNNNFTVLRLIDKCN